MTEKANANRPGVQLQMNPRPARSDILDQPFPWLLYGSELIGTALLLTVGLSIVIVDFAQNSPVAEFLPNFGWRRLITGFLFGTTGAIIAVSPLGRESGAHLNPAVTLGFLLMGKLRIRHAVGYAVAQVGGAVIGSLPLLLWGGLGQSVEFGATFPGPGYGNAWALLGEIAATFALIVALFFFLQHRMLRTFAPGIFPVLYALMVFLEAPVSGTSTNPARSFGPAVISGHWTGWWVYWLGPLIGTLLGVAACRLTKLCRSRIKVAKIHHFDHDRYGVFRI